jgi:hypothetical protein
LTEWRQSSHNIKKIKRLFRKAQKLKRSPSQKPEKKEGREKLVIAAPVELGLKVCVLEDQYGFILHHQVMQNETDEQVAISMIKCAQKKFTLLSICSFDKGFHSPRNQTELAELLDYVVLPKKGRLSRKDKGREHSKEFVKTRYQHAAVESAIDALEVYGLDRCPDHGLHGFSRYVSLSVLSRNIQLVGVAIKKQQRATKKDKEKLKLAA